PGRPGNPAEGIVWTSIVHHIDDPSWDDAWITVTDLDRTLLAKHPWSLSGGGTVALLKRINEASKRPLIDTIESIGFSVVTGDDAVFAPGRVAPKCWIRDHVPTRLFIEGDRVRDWRANDPDSVAFPYDGTAPILGLENKFSFWPFRTGL